MPSADAEVKAPIELRLALVCYGGVSLAVYMHGVTKELHKLVRASQQFDSDCDAGTVKPEGVRVFPVSADGSNVEFDTEELYYAALRELRAKGQPLTAVIDVIAGTSAGGINGVFLGRALAHGRSLNGLRSLWLRDGDLDVLLNGHAGIGSHRARMIEKMGVAVAKLLTREHHADAPLNGDLMSQLLYRALHDMPQVGPTSLVKPSQSLDLFVPITDVHGYSTAVPTGSGGISHTDRAFQQVAAFHYDQRPTSSANADHFADDSVPALAFAARATSSFPGAFPSVSLGTFAAAVNGEYPDAIAGVGPIADRLMFQGEYGSEPALAWYMDGGVLDNGPFDHVIEAIARKRASGPVKREIIYIEPDPGGPPPADHEIAQPSWLKVIMASRTTIPWHTSLVDTLNQLRDMNASIAEVGAIADSQGKAVTAEMSALQLGVDTEYQTMIDKGPTIRSRARELTGLTYSTYCRLRADAVAFEVADTLATKLGFPPRSNKHEFVISVITSWLLAKNEWSEVDPAVLESELGAVDAPFRLRRASFVLQGINTMLSTPGLARARMDQLGTLKSACWDLIEELRGLVDAATSTAAVLDRAKALLGVDALDDRTATSDPRTFAESHEKALNDLFDTYRDNLGTAGTSQALWKVFTANIAGWDDRSAVELASRYLLFPIWDAVIFPTVALARLPQLSNIGVRRFSPLDATTLTPPHQPDFGATKLKGTAIHHFGGFFDEGWRENDYLWGRLDGVDLIFELLGAHGGGVDLVEQRKKAFSAALDAEAGALTHIRTELETIRGYV